MLQDGGVMVSELALGVVDCWFKPDRVKPKTAALQCTSLGLGTSYDRFILAVLSLDTNYESII